MKSFYLLACAAIVTLMSQIPANAHYPCSQTDDSPDSVGISGSDLVPGILDNLGEEDDEGLPSSTPHLTTRDTVRTYNLSGHPTNAANSAHSIYIYKGQKRIR